MEHKPQTELMVCPTRLRVYVLGPTRIDCWDPPSRTFIPMAGEKLRVKGALQGQTLMELLISQPQRTAHRDWVLEQFWPTTTKRKAEQNLDNMSNYLHTLLSGLTEDGGELFCYVRKIKSIGGTYRLAQHPLVWVDADAFLWYMQHAALYKRMGDDPLPLLEAAYPLGARGTYLVEAPYSDWAKTRRTELDGAFRSCVHQLGHLYLKRACFSEAEFFVRSYWAAHTADEDALRLLMTILGKQERFQEAHACYRQTCEMRGQAGETIDSRTHDLAEYWRSKLLSPPAKPAPQPSPVPSSAFPFWTILEHLLTPRLPESRIAQQPDASLAPTWSMTYNTSSQLSSLPNLGILELLMLSRRQTLRNLISIAGSSLVFSPNVWFPQEGREHLERAITSSSYLDEEAIDHLAAITQNFWELHKTTAGIGLVDGIASHLATITQFLKESRPTDIHKKLMGLACETARLLGAIFHEIREYNLAWDSYVFALNTAQEIHDPDMWGSVVARLAQLLTFWREPQEALPFLEEAHKRGIHDPRLRVQLVSYEAEIYARAKDMDTYLRVLERSKTTPLTVSLTDDRYRTGFTPSVAKGWEAACWIWLHEPELALPILNESFATYDPTSMLRRSYLLANSGWVHGQLGDVTKACEQLLESLSITAQTKSLVTLQMIYQGRADLEPWKNSSDVKDLDARIVEVYKSLVRVKERV